MAERLNIKDSIQQWVDKINAVFDLQNVDGSFVNQDSSWDDTVFTLSGGKIRTGTQTVDIQSDSLTLPTAEVSIVGVDTSNEELAHFLESDVPGSGFIPLYVVTANNERIVDVEDVRTPYIA